MPTHQQPHLKNKFSWSNKNQRETENLWECLIYNMGQTATKPDKVNNLYHKRLQGQLNWGIYNCCKSIIIKNQNIYCII